MSGAMEASRTGGQRPIVRKRRCVGWTEAKREAFLAALAQTCNVSASARKVKLTAQGAYKLRLRDAGFRAGWQEALEQGYERLEMALLERALNGTQKPVWYRGEVVGEETRFSDAVQLTLYRAHRASAKQSQDEEEDYSALREEIVARLIEIGERLAADE